MGHIKSENEEKKVRIGTSLVVQWLKLHTPNAGGQGSGSIPDQGAELPHAAGKVLHATAKTQCSQINK